MSPTETQVSRHWPCMINEGRKIPVLFNNNIKEISSLQQDPMSAKKMERKERKKKDAVEKMNIYCTRVYERSNLRGQASLVSLIPRAANKVGGTVINH